MMCRFRPIVLVVAVLVTLAGSGPAPARGAEFYYVLIFGSQSQPKRLKYSHTWATFIKADGDGLDPDAYSLTAHTISWLPRTLDVRVWSPVPEEGVNLSLDDTIRFVMGQDQQIRLWGPFIVTRELYERSLRVYSILENGQARYRAISGQYDLLISDCIHAVAAVDPELGRDHYPLIRVGIPASRHIARQIVMRSIYDQTQSDHSWLIPRLGLDRYPMTVVPPRSIDASPCFLCIHPE
ncbi:MAG: hypothetical protein U0794_12995 [Isosphaeraceae bacterium]